MTKRSTKVDDPLEDFTPREITLDGITKLVHVAGTGPGVIVMTEMPGISPHVARFSRWVRDAGFTVYMPSLFGRDGVVTSAEEGVAIFQRACVSAEFRALSANVSSPVTLWLRALARLAHQECGGPGVGAIGMCFTGNFALTMMLEPAMLAPVLSQPALPLNDPAGIEIAAEEIKAVRDRLEREDLTVLAYRFAGDRFDEGSRPADGAPETIRGALHERTDRGVPIRDAIAPDQDDEDVHRPRSEWHDLCAIGQEPVADRQLKRTEAQNFAVLTAHGMFLIRAGSMTSLLYLVFASPTGWTLSNGLPE